MRDPTTCPAKRFPDWPRSNRFTLLDQLLVFPRSLIWQTANKNSIISNQYTCTASWTQLNFSWENCAFSRESHCTNFMIMSNVPPPATSQLMERMDPPLMGGSQTQIPLISSKIFSILFGVYSLPQSSWIQCWSLFSLVPSTFSCSDVANFSSLRFFWVCPRCRVILAGRHKCMCGK